MELDKEFIESNGLNEDQVKAISGHFTNILADEKKAIEDTFSGKANEDAEGILSGYVNSVMKEFNVDVPREEGEKVKDWASKVLPKVFLSEREKLNKLKSDYEAKIKEGGANVDDIKKQYEAEKDELLKKYAGFDEFKEKAEKADEYSKQLSGLKLQVAYGNVKPQFGNEFDKDYYDYKWSEFQKRMEENNTVELDQDNVAWLIDKENHHKRKKLSEAVEQDEMIQKLVSGRQQQGSGTKPVTMNKIEGVPFEVPANASGNDISKAIKDYLAKQNIGNMHPEFANKFKELHNKIKQKTAA